MKQKVVIRVVSMKSPKSRTKAMKIAVGVSGVMSVELGGDNMDQIVVIGEGIDATCLIRSIRKKIGFADLVSLTPVEKKKEEIKEKSGKICDGQPVTWDPCQYGTRHVYVTEIQDRRYDPCTIM